jgi:hypothetical protein
MEQRPNRKKTLETLAILAAVLELFYLASHKALFALAALALLAVALFFRRTAASLAAAWLAFSEVIGGFNNRVVLGAVYFLILTPLAFGYRLFGGASSAAADPAAGSYFVEKKHLFVPEDLQKPW